MVSWVDQVEQVETIEQEKSLVQGNLILEESTSTPPTSKES